MTAAADTAQAAPFRLKLWPILAVAAMGFGVPELGALLASLSSKLFHTPAPTGPLLPWLYAQHAGQLIVALIAIAILKQFIPANFGLQWPPGKTYLWPAILWGLFFGVLMTLVDWAPQILAGTKPHLDYPLSRDNVVGWLFFEGVYVGPTEEIPFRGLLVTFLAATMPGKLHVGRYEMNWAGVIVAIIFALLHANSFFGRAWPLALGQQLYAFALGVLYAYWLEKSKSVLAPSVGHNVGDVTEYAILFAWIAFL